MDIKSNSQLHQLNQTSTQTLKICQINIRKLPDVQSNFEDLLCDKYNIICIQEPHFNKRLDRFTLSSRTCIVGLNNYESRCITIFNKNKINVIELSGRTTPFLNCIDIVYNNYKLRLVNCYIPPKDKNNKQLIYSIIIKLKQSITGCVNTPLLLFNSSRILPKTNSSMTLYLLLTLVLLLKSLHNAKFAS